MPYGYEGDYVIHGPPGTGKTTRLARTVARICAQAPPEAFRDGRSPCIVVSLTKAAAKEAAGRDLPIPPDAVSTLHSVGYRSLGAPDVVSSSLVTDEWPDFLRREGRALGVKEAEGFSDLSPAFFSREFDDEDDDPVFHGGAARPDDGTTNGTFLQMELDRHRMIPPDARGKLVRELSILWSVFKRAFGAVDFTDMIEHGRPSYLCPGVILADEAQDLSPLEFAYIRRLAADTGAAIILTGDAHQALYHWRGADWRVLFDPSIPKDHVDVLRQSYRVPRAVHAKALEYIGRMPGYVPVVYLPRDADGEVLKSDSTYFDLADIVGRAERAWLAGRSFMLLAATNYMADAIVKELRDRALPYGNPWRMKRGIWNPLAPRKGVTKRERLLAVTKNHDTRGEDGIGEPWTLAEIRAFVHPMRAAVLPRGTKARLDKSCADRNEARRVPAIAEVQDILGEPFLRALVDAPDGKAVAKWWYRHLLARDQGATEYPVAVYSRWGRHAIEEPIIRGSKHICAGTFFSVKGGEADEVAIFPDTSPACERERAGSEEGEAAVCRMFYVGATRARETLHLCEPAGGFNEGSFDL